jgi:hypothetical protein
MKKKIVLLPLLLFTLSACSGMDLPRPNNDEQSDASAQPQSSFDPNDAAIKILNMVTIFPEVGDAVDFNEYVDFAAEYEHTITEYTFTSSDQNVIRVNGYAAECVGSGYATVSLSGPGINQPTSLSFYVGSIAGTYLPDSSPLYKDKARTTPYVTFTIGEANAERECAFSFDAPEAFNHRKTTPIEAFHNQGVYIKDGSPFLALNFEAGAPKYFSPVTDYLAMFDLDLGLDIDSNIYGLLSYDEIYGVCVKTIFNNELVEFYIAE